jgi:Ricin-type beta-trefoil lectin domain-like
MRKFTAGNVVLAAASAAMFLGAGAAPAFAATNHRGKADPVATAASSSNIIFHVYDAIPDKTLTGVTSQDYISDGFLASGNDVGTANLTHVDRFQLYSKNGSADGEFYYNIGDAGSNGKSQYELRIWGYNWSLGSDISCDIYDSASGKATSDSPYKCDRKKQGGGDQDDSFVVEPKDAATHTISDNSRFNRQKMLDAWCDVSGDHQYSDCKAVSASDESIGYGQYRPSSATVLNCTASDATQGIEFSTTDSETDTLGVKLTVSGKLFDMLQTELEASYQHAWTKSKTQGQTVNMTIKPNSYGWVDSAQKLLFVKGDYKVTVGNQTYEVDGVGFTAPASENNNASYRLETAEIPAGSTVCSDNNAGRLNASADAPRGGVLYRIGIAGANQHVIQSPNGDRGEARLQLGQKDANAYNQQWLVTTHQDGYDTFESDDNSDLCLAHDPYDGGNYPGVYQRTCDGSSSQQWSVTYVPAKSGYVLTPKDGEDAALGVFEAGNGIGAAIDLHHPLSDAQAWQFQQVG